jgi:hypothetical protein
MTADGTDDYKICPVAGLQDYMFYNNTELANNDEENENLVVLHSYQCKELKR